MINTTLSFARRKRPKENNLPMKDKSLSPKKKPTRKQMGVSKKGLPVQKKKDKKRYGVIADICKKRIISISSLAKKLRKTKGKCKFTSFGRSDQY